MKIESIKHIWRDFWTGVASLLPNDHISNKVRVFIFKRAGIQVAKNVSIHRNVLLLGNVSIGEGSSISNNSSINGASVGVTIGDHVMIAPGCCIVAFDHGTQDNSVPMIKQPIVEKAIQIMDDVWVGANCTITKGVTIHTGAIVGANSVITKDVSAYSIVAGVPAKLLKMRFSDTNLCELEKS